MRCCGNCTWSISPIIEDDLISRYKVLLKNLNYNLCDFTSIQFNMDDTITNPNYYSNCAASPYGLNDPTKYGRNFSGAFYKVKKMR